MGCGSVDGTRRVVWCYSEGVPNREAQAEGSFAAHWRDTGGPEFERGDLDDLIAALSDLRDS